MRIFSVNIDIWPYATGIIALLVIIIIAKSKAATVLLGLVTTTSEARLKRLSEVEAENIRLSAELRLTTRELRQAREFNDEDRRLIRRMEALIEIHEREINGHRLHRNMPPLLAGGLTYDDKRGPEN